MKLVWLSLLLVAGCVASSPEVAAPAELHTADVGAGPGAPTGPEHHELRNWLSGSPVGTLDESKIRYRWLRRVDGDQDWLAEQSEWREVMRRQSLYSRSGGIGDSLPMPFGSGMCGPWDTGRGIESP